MSETTSEGLNFKPTEPTIQKVEGEKPLFLRLFSAVVKFFFGGESKDSNIAPLETNSIMTETVKKIEEKTKSEPFKNKPGAADAVKFLIGKWGEFLSPEKKEKP